MILGDFIRKLEFGTTLRIWSDYDQKVLYEGKFSWEDCKEIEAEEWCCRNIIAIVTSDDYVQIELVVE